MIFLNSFRCRQVSHRWKNFVDKSTSVGICYFESAEYRADYNTNEDVSNQDPVWNVFIHVVISVILELCFKMFYLQWNYVKLSKNCRYIDRALNYFQNIDVRELVC